VSEIAIYRAFRLEVARTARLSPSFLRVTFAGEELSSFAVNGLDQRIKVVLPLPGSGFESFPDGPDWFPRWRALPAERKNPLRTYTARAVRPDLGELDVDFVLHGDGGPASRWALAARPGHRVVVIGPNGRYPGNTNGLEWAPPAGATRLLLAGDETAVPAISAIAETLTGEVPARILLEVPEPQDVLDLPTKPGIRVTWLPRNGKCHGELLAAAVREATRGWALDGSSGAEPEDVDVDVDLLWEVPMVEGCAGLGGQPGPYAWLAGEAGAVKHLRRYLVQELGMDRASVAFMGYWRLGRAEAA
jgi:NADPH-dependent ferric siderophore reductase